MICVFLYHGMFSKLGFELLAGAWALPFANRHHFNLNLTNLLDQSTK